MIELLQKFNRYTILSFSHKKGNHFYYKCECDCGEKKTVCIDNLKNESTKSCGCLRKEVRTKHDMSRTGFYRKFTGAQQRCNATNHKDFSNYGGRGIKCLWTSFYDFKDDMYESYLSHSCKFGNFNTTLERINVDGNYEKSNCRWATKKEQTRNRTNTIYITLDNNTKSLGEWAEYLGVKDYLIRNRFNRGWSPERMLTKTLC